MRTDRELLELAAKAAGYEPQGMEQGLMYLFGVQDGWNPLTDDGDALRLAVDANVQFGLVLEDARGYAESGSFYIDFDWDMHRPSDRYEALRRAIVRVAAERAAQVSPPALNTDGGSNG